MATATRTAADVMGAATEQDLADRDFNIAAYQCKRILAKLQQITDAPASRLQEGPKPPRFAETKVPEGVRLNQRLRTVDGARVTDSAPSKTFSLWAHYSHRIERAYKARDASQLLKLAACATRDYEIYLGQRTTQHADHDDAVMELLRDFTGVAATEASWWLDTSEKWVRRHRVLNGRDPETGEPTATQSEKNRRVMALSKDGWKHQQIADEVGLTRQRVQQILAGG